MPDPLLSKLLSHRLSGFADIEQTPTAFERACASPVPYLEVDTRAGRDGALYCYHDPRTGRDVDAARTLATATAAEIDRLRYTNGEPLLSLEHALDLFRQRAVAQQRLCLDVKDYGFEVEHLDLVRRAGLEDVVCFVSWIPRTLLRLHALGCTAPLVLSHWNLLSWGLGGCLLSGLFRGSRWRFGRHVLIGRDRFDADPGAWGHGFQHALVCRELPAALAAALAGSGGGICVHRSLLGNRLAAYCRRHGLRLWVYAVRTGEAFVRLATRPGVDVVFSDDAPAVLAHLGVEGWAA